MSDVVTIPEEDSPSHCERGFDFEVLCAEIGRKLDECLRVCRQEQARNDADLQKRYFELADGIKVLEGAGDNGSA